MKLKRIISAASLLRECRNSSSVAIGGGIFNHSTDCSDGLARLRRTHTGGQRGRYGRT